MCGYQSGDVAAIAARIVTAPASMMIPAAPSPPPELEPPPVQSYGTSFFGHLGRKNFGPGWNDAWMRRRSPCAEAAGVKRRQQPSAARSANRHTGGLRANIGTGLI